MLNFFDPQFLHIGQLLAFNRLSDIILYSLSLRRLVSIKAISVNPLDTKVRRGTIPPPENENMPRILGWAAGEVTAVGSDCTLFQKGDAVYYAGSITRQGTLRISSGRRTYCWKKTKIT